MTSVSVTEVRNALRCPRVFALGRQVSKRVAFPVGASGLGAIFHRIAERFVRQVAAGDPRLRAARTDEPLDAVAHAISRALLAPLVEALGRDASLAAMPAEVDDLAEALRAYAGYLAARVARSPGRLDAVLGRFLHAAEVPVELRLPTPAGPVRLSGRVDAVHAPDEHTYEIVEYKLTDDSSEELDRAQVALYRRMLAPDVEAVPVILRFGPSLLATRLEPAEADAWVERAIVPLLGRMVEWATRPERAPATTRTDLCGVCPLRAECAALYRDRVASRDDPPASALRPRPSPGGETLELPVTPAGAAGDFAAARGLPAADPDAEAEAAGDAERLAALIVRLYADQGVAARAREPAVVTARKLRIEVTAARGSVAGLDRAQADVLHHLEADEGIAARYVQEGGLRVFLAPRRRPRAVRLGPLLQASRPWLSERAGRCVLGEREDGSPLRLDLSEPGCCHVLVGGEPGSGKSVLLKVLAAGLAEAQPPCALQLVLVDPKRVTFGGMAGSLAAHLARPPCFDAAEAVGILADLVADMQARYERFQACSVEDLLEHDALAGTVALPRRVVIVDEFQDLLAERASRDDFLAAVQRLGAKGRAAGIHLVLATQHPDRKTVPAAIKVNLVAKIALKVHQATDSMVLLGRRGAESLLGKGDLLAELGAEPVRAQCATP